MNIKQKLVSAATVAGMMAVVLAPASFASNTVKIKHNGAFSHSSAIVKNVSFDAVVQGNATSTQTQVMTGTNTGNNSSSFNVGGTNTITTGSVTNTVKVTNNGDTNINSGSCGCNNPGPTDVVIKGNGAFSSNHVSITNTNMNVVGQFNYSQTETGVMTGSNTGGNSSSFNVGGGTTTTTGDATTSVTVTNGGSTNVNGPIAL